MDSILLLVNSAPSTANAQRAWQMAHTLHGQGYPVTLFLIQDGVLAAGPGAAALRELPRDIVCYALAEDLRLRGLVSDVPSRIREAGYAQLVDLFGENARVIGAF